MSLFSLLYSILHLLSSLSLRYYLADRLSSLFSVLCSLFSGICSLFSMIYPLLSLNSSPFSILSIICSLFSIPSSRVYIIYYLYPLLHYIFSLPSSLLYILSSRFHSMCYRLYRLSCLSSLITPLSAPSSISPLFCLESLYRRSIILSIPSSLVTSYPFSRHSSLFSLLLYIYYYLSSIYYI